MLSLFSAPASLACFTPAVIVSPARRAHFDVGLSQQPVHDVAAVTISSLFSDSSIFRNSSHFATAFRGWAEGKTAYLMSTRAAWTWALQNEHCACPWLLLLEDDAVLPPGVARLVPIILAHHSNASVVTLDVRAGSYSADRVGRCCLAATLYRISALPALLDRLDPERWRQGPLRGVDLALLPLLNDLAANHRIGVANVPIVGTSGVESSLPDDPSKAPAQRPQMLSEKAWPWTKQRTTWPDWLEMSVRSTTSGRPPRCFVAFGQGGTKPVAGLLPMDMHLCKSTAGQPLESPTASGAWRFSEAKKCFTLDIGLAQALAALLEGRTVTDLGAGVGCYAAALTHLGVRSVLALDGTTGIDKTTGGRVQTWDLSDATAWLPRADYALSLEVAEHIPARSEHAFLRYVEMASCGAVVSWAEPGQGGIGHVNERSTSYVQAALRKRGLWLDQNVTQKLREAAGLPYLRRTVALYVKRDAPPRCLGQTAT